MQRLEPRMSIVSRVLRRPSVNHWYSVPVKTILFNTWLMLYVFSCITYSYIVLCLVGVDLNHAPAFLLRHVTGISAKLADKIVEKRQSLKCGFLSRNDLLDIKGLGKKTFEQCAGFVKIIPDKSNGEK